jgi:hypothetical protein
MLRFIRSKLIPLFLLREHGGVVMSSSFILAESLDWLKTIHKSIIVNRGNRNVKPQYFTFFLMNASPGWEKRNREVDFEIEKLVYMYPSIADYFLAGVPKGEFIDNFINSYLKLLISNLPDRNEALSKNGIQRSNLDPNNIYHLYSLAAQMAVQLKQKELDQTQKESKYQQFAIDYYGLVTMNEYYGPQKMYILFKNRLNTRNYFDNFYNLLAKLPQSEFEEVMGPMRFVINPEPYGDEFNRRIERAKSGSGYEIWEGSFIHRHLFLGRQEEFIKPNKEKSVTPATFSKWESLPKKLWIFWDSGVENASAASQLCVLNLVKNAKLAGFEVHLVNDSNLKDYLSQSEISRIEETIKKAQFNVPKQIKSDFIRLALIAAHGGIYMDASYLWF